MVTYRVCASVLALTFFAAMANDDDHAGHDHLAHDHDHHAGHGVFEWGGIFKTPEDTYLWTAQKTRQIDGSVKYVDPKMKMVVLKTNSSTDAAFDAAKEEAAHGFEKTCSEVEAGESIAPKEDACYELHFKQSRWQTLFDINTTGADYIAIFTEHFPTEFENTAHYLKDDHGDDVEPVHTTAEEMASAEPAKPWGAAIGASIIVNLITLSGVILAVPVIKKAAQTYAAQFEAILSAFAAGALMACAFFLLLFESTHLIATGYDQEVDTTWRWGTMTLAGFLLPALTQMVSGEVHVLIGGGRKGDEQSAQPNAVVVEAVETGDAADMATKDTPSASLPVRCRLIGGVLIGDFFHNLCDGFFIGTAFAGCGNSFGWSVVLGTAIHELFQEIADYAILTGSVARLRPVTALVCNFISGLSVLLGAIIVLSTDIGHESTGLMLAFGGGVYLHIAATECMPRIYNDKLSRLVRAVCVLLFIVGAIAIGLVLLDHEHCTKKADGSEDDAHAGHNHR